MDFAGQVITTTVNITPVAVNTPPLFDLSNAVWQGIGGLAGIVAIIITLVVLYTSRQRKVLSYTVLAYVPLISVKEEEELKSRLQILFDGQPAQNLDIGSLIIRFNNVGNQDIGEDDYAGHPIEIRFEDTAEVLTTPILVATGPEDFDVILDKEQTKGLIHPTLLNKGQSLTIKLLVKQSRGFRVYARIKGTKVIRSSTIQPNYLLITLPYIITILTISFIIMTAISNSTSSSGTLFFVIGAASMIIYSLIGMVYAIYLARVPQSSETD